MIAYLSSEFAIDDNWPSYAGGLGVLAGDILRETSDSSFPLIGVSLFYHQGIFQQEIDPFGKQKVYYPSLVPHQYQIEEVLDQNNEPLTIQVPLPDHSIYLKVLRKMVGGTPLYLLDANIPANNTEDQKTTARLYENEWAPHLNQDIALGIGSVRLVKALNLPVKIWHINDDHAGFNILERIRDSLTDGKNLEQAITEIGKSTVFTTHTPVAGAESLFSPEEIAPFLKTLFSGLNSFDEILKLGGVGINNRQNFSLSVLCLNLAGRVNAVSKRHSQFSKKLWSFLPPFSEDDQNPKPIIPITNAIHPLTWTAKPMQEFYAKFLDNNWIDKTNQPELWQKIQNAPAEKLWQARKACKKFLIEEIKLQTGNSLPNESLILGFAKRFAPYKRPLLLLSDLDRLTKLLTDDQQPVFLIISGKAHPLDTIGQSYIQEIIAASHNSSLHNHLIFLPNYDLRLAKTLVVGADVWINLPQPPMEASGTSGMKALYNGGLNLMISDGWWYEAYNGENGWLVGPKEPDIEKPISDQETAKIVYDLLEKEVQPLYFKQENGLPVLWLKKIKNALLTTASFLSTKRLLKEYQQQLYEPLGFSGL